MKYLLAVILFPSLAYSYPDCALRRVDGVECITCKDAVGSFNENNQTISVSCNWNDPNGRKEYKRAVAEYNICVALFEKIKELRQATGEEHEKLNRQLEDKCGKYPQ